MAAASETTPPQRQPSTSDGDTSKPTPSTPAIAPSGDRPFNVYVKNFTAEVDDKMLHSMFEGFGTIQSCTVLHDHLGRSKLVGFVQFSSDDEAKRAVQEMHNKTGFGPKALHVALTNKKPANSRRRHGLNYYAYDYTPMRQAAYGPYPMSSPNTSPTPSQTLSGSPPQAYGPWGSPGPMQVIYVPYNPYEYSKPPLGAGQYSTGGKLPAPKPRSPPASSSVYSGAGYHEQYMPSHYMMPGYESYHPYSPHPYNGYNAGWGTPYCHPYGQHPSAQSMGYAYA